MKLVVSACLTGRRCRYDAKTKSNARVNDAVTAWRAEGGTVVSVCPEELGGLSTPRPPCDLHKGDGAAVWEGQAEVRGRIDKLNRTEAYLTGARRALLQAEGSSRAILKAKSPSCGCGSTWVDGELQNGDGVFAAALRKRGVELLTEENL